MEALRLNLALRLNSAVVQSIWLKQGRKHACQVLIPEVAWPLLDSPGSGTFRFPEMASGGVQAAPACDGSQTSLRTQDRGSVSDCDTDWDEGSDCDPHKGYTKAKNTDGAQVQLGWCGKHMAQARQEACRS